MPLRPFVLPLALALITVPASAITPQPGPQLLCHRTANEDVPENTLESLEEAALLGCNVIEIDVRRTLDGELILNHDGLLDRLTDGSGVTENTFYDELTRLDFGIWMGDRFRGMRIARLDDALRLARRLDVRLVLDIKTRGIGPEVLQELTREGMLERVQFNGEWDDIRKLDPKATDAGHDVTWVRAGVTAAQVAAEHAKGRAVVANFSDSPQQEMDLTAMKAAVAAGVDAINVDYPRLGADAVGRPVEQTVAHPASQAEKGDPLERAKLILQLAHYRGLPLEQSFLRWLDEPNEHVSRAAAIALVETHPQAQPSVFAEALHSTQASSRANAAWALGQIHAPASLLTPLLYDVDSTVLQQTLLALARLDGDVPLRALQPLLSHYDLQVRAAAALALAKHQPAHAAPLIATQLRAEMQSERVLYDAYTTRKPQHLSGEEIRAITSSFRCQMKMVEALGQLRDGAALRELEAQAFRPGADFSQMNAIVAAFELWDRIGADPQAAISALGSDDAGVADRAEWMLIQAGPAVLPAARNALKSSDAAVRERAIRIVSFQGDRDSLPMLRSMSGKLATDAITRIEALQPTR